MIRAARWAGQFYPADPVELTREVEDLLSRGGNGPETPWAVLVPHAGYIYSGATAAMALARLDWRAIKRVVMLGPAHHSPVAAVALTEYQKWNSPLGAMSLDTQGCRELLGSDPLFQVDERAHALEHSLEVQIPFLRVLAPEAQLLPILIGHLTHEERGRFLSSLKKNSRPGDIWLVTTDLSHFYHRDEAEIKDAMAERLIQAGRVADLVSAFDCGRIEACGAAPLLCLLTESAGRGGRIEIVDRRDSSAASGDISSVVGYLSAIFLEGGS